MKKISLKTDLGYLFEGDCINVMQKFPSESIDLFFADPPFNLSKIYASGINDKISEHDYIEWCKKWINEGIRLLKPGGSFFIYNLPKWNIPCAAIIGSKLTFKNWIAVDMKMSLPIKGRLYPAHYSLLYYVKDGKKPKFHPDRTPIQCCRHCQKPIKDYGGHIKKLNESGLNISDVWTDISPVRHQKYKTREANQLPLKLMDRIISMTTDEHDVVLDPFVGSGTTAVVCELKKRHWIGIDLNCAESKFRLENLGQDQINLEKIQTGKNKLYE